MITIFSSPKAFVGHIGIIQRNAILSWLRLYPQCEIILFGNDPGTKDFCNYLKLIHVPDVATNEFGTPLLSDMFRRVQQIGRYDLFFYINADIIILSNLTKEILLNLSNFQDRFLLVGRRLDMNIRLPLVFNSQWETNLRKNAAQVGKLAPASGIDYFIYPRGCFKEIPDFTIGRPAWDNWMIYSAITTRIQLIDVTSVIPIIHQNHDYLHIPSRTGIVWEGPEAQKNRNLAIKNSSQSFEPRNFTIDNVPWRLVRSGVKKNYTFRYFRCYFLIAYRIYKQQITASIFNILRYIVNSFLSFSEKYLPQHLHMLIDSKVSSMRSLFWLFFSNYTEKNRNYLHKNKNQEVNNPIKKNKIAVYTLDDHDVNKLLLDIYANSFKKDLKNCYVQKKEHKQSLLISVVICTYNRAHLLTDCLESLYHQDLDENSYEVLVVDNNSSDNTKEIVEQFGKRIKNLYYLFEPRQGLSYARNTGWCEAKGRYVGYVDDECKMPTKWLNAAVEIIDYCEPEMFGGPYVADFNFNVPKWILPPYFSTFIKGANKRFLKNDEFIDGGNMFIRRDLFEEFGGFDTKIGMKGKQISFGEETIFQKNIRRHIPDAKIIITPELLVKHLVSTEKLKYTKLILIWFASGYHNYQIYDYIYKVDVDLRYKIIVTLILIGNLMRLLASVGWHISVLCLFRNRQLYSYWQNYVYEIVCPKISQIGNTCRNISIIW